MDANTQISGQQTQSRSQGAQPAGPAPRGLVSTLISQLQFLRDPFKTVQQRFERYGNIYRVVQGKSAFYVAREPEHVREVLVSNAAAFDKQHSAFQRLSLLLGDALLTSDGERWRRQRRLVQPAFARPRLIEYSAVMADEAAKLLERLPRGTRIDIAREINGLTLRIVTRTLFGQELVEAENGETARAMRDLNRWFAVPALFLRLTPGARKALDRAMITLDAKIAQLIEAKREQLTREPERCTDLLSALLSARDADGAALAPRELRDQLLTLYLAGHETTSQALTFTLYLLSQHPHAQETLHAELERVLQGRTPGYADLERLPYTEQVVKEALRLYPPAPVIPRRAALDATLGPYEIPRGSEVVLWSYLVHRDPRYYPQPERFLPERFTPEAEATRPKGSYLPFGAGQRACIGQAFAMIETQLVLATLAAQLRFEHAGRGALRLRAGVTISPRGGMPMRVYARS
jgi:cytochrome P450